MNDNDGKKSLDNFIGIMVGLMMVLFFIFKEPFLMVILLPATIFAFIVYTNGSPKRDEYYKSKFNILIVVIICAVVPILFYYIADDSFEQFKYEQDYYVILAFLLCVVSLFFVWFSKRVIPISFLHEDDRIVQETMYEDYDYSTLSDVYSYRGVKFRDEKGNKCTSSNVLNKASGKLTSTLLDIHDIEIEVLNTDGKLKFYYEKLIYDMYNDFVLNRLKKQDLMMKRYGYNLTFDKSIRNVVDFRNSLAKESLLFSKIFSFVEKDMKNESLQLRLNLGNILKDNFYCLELSLIAAIMMLRQYANFPVGDMPKYVKSKKDKNFIGCFSSLPTDYKNLNSTSVSASGIAYYYIFYKLHIKWFNEASNKEVIDRWLKK